MTGASLLHRLRLTRPRPDRPLNNRAALRLRGFASPSDAGHSARDVSRECLSPVLGRWRLECHLFSARRMFDRQGAGMQREVSSVELGFRTVAHITDERHSARGKLYTDLMRPACLKPDVHERDALPLPFISPDHAIR